MAPIEFLAVILTGLGLIVSILYYTTVLQNARVSPVNHASVCIACGKCEEKCPQELPIRKFMNEATRIFPSTQE